MNRQVETCGLTAFSFRETLTRAIKESDREGMVSHNEDFVNGVVAVTNLLDTSYPLPLFLGWEIINNKPTFLISKRIDYGEYEQLVTAVHNEWKKVSGFPAEGYIVIIRIHDEDLKAFASADTMRQVYDLSKLKRVPKEVSDRIQSRHDIGTVGPIGSTSREDAYFHQRDREIIEKLKGNNAI